MKKIIYLIIALILISSASAYESKEKYVKLIENTDHCLTHCHTIYEINAFDRDLTISPENLYFKFRTIQDMNKVNSLNELKSSTYSITEKTISKEITGYKNIEYDCSKEQEANKTEIKPCIRREPIYSDVEHEIYKGWKEPVTLKQGETTKIRIDGIKEPL